MLSPTGEVVRTLVRAGGVGLNSLVWDGKAASGAMLPRGVYMVEITAQAESGSAARAVTTVAAR